MADNPPMPWGAVSDDPDDVLPEAVVHEFLKSKTGLRMIVNRCSRTYLLSEEESENLMGDSACVILKNRARIRDLLAYAREVVYTQRIGLFRKKRRWRELPEIVDSIRDWNVWSSSSRETVEIEEIDLNMMLREGIDRLTAEEREAFCLLYLSGEYDLDGVPEIHARRDQTRGWASDENPSKRALATHLGISRETLEKRLQSALRKLKRHLSNPPRGGRRGNGA